MFFSFLVVLVFAVATSTISWLTPQNELFFPKSFGKATASYFKEGDGTEDSPYIVSNAVHLYNLAWLQYIGYFNLKPSLNNGLAQSYFKIDDAVSSIDMNGLTLPPIGTVEYPFIGKFDGNGKTITSLTVSNVKDDFQQKPITANFPEKILNTNQANATEVSVVGLFGVVGDYNDYIDGYKTVIANSDLEDKGNNFSEADMSVSGFYMDKLCVKSGAASTLAGLIAGSVWGNLQNVGVYRCKFDFSGVTGGLDGTTVSKYSLVGDYGSNVGWGSGNATGWGGSIDMRTLNRRLNYMYSAAALYGTTTTDEGQTVSSDVYNVKLTSERSSANDEFYWQAHKDQVMYLLDGTIIPLNVNTEEMKIDSLDSDDSVVSIDGWDYHIGTKDDNNKQAYYGNVAEVLKNNTGYLVGDATVSGNTCVRAGTRRLASGSYSGYNGIKASFDLVNNTSDFQYDAARFALYTVKGNDTYRIIDDVNREYYQNNNNVQANNKDVDELGFTHYTSVRSNFDKSMDGAYTLHGFHFTPGKKGVWDGILYNGIYTTTVNGVAQTKAFYTDENENGGYQFVKGGLNFTVEKNGVITVILGSGYTSGKHSLFDMYKVSRTNGKIDDNGITKIDKIYTDGDNVYYDDEDKPDSATQVFSIESLSSGNVLQADSAFYFEIPVSAGDYFIGCDYKWNDDTYTAYLMYLDIGANGSDEKDPDYTMKNVDFIDGRAVSNDTVSVPTNNGAAYYPEYEKVTVELSKPSDASSAIFRRDGSATAESDLNTTLYYLTSNLTANVSGKGEIDTSLNTIKFTE